jgi:hypothetical protein
MSDTLTVSLVRGNDGSIDTKASADAFSSALKARIAASESETTEIASAVSAVYDQYKGSWMTLPYLTSCVLTKLNAQPENSSALSKRIGEYVRNSSKGESATLTMKKGVGGGFARSADLVVDPA